MVDRLLDRIDAWQRRRTWSAFTFGVIKKFGDDRAGSLAALVAYYAFFSIFPLLLVLTTVLGWALDGNPELRQDLLDSALGQFPVIGDQMRVGQLPGSGVAFAIGLVGALWGGMGAVMAMQNALDGVWNVPLKQRPNLVVGRLRALAMLAVLGVGILVLTLAGSATQVAADIPVVGAVASFAVSFALGLGLFLVAFRLLCQADVSWRDLLPGAIAAALSWSVLQLVGTAVVQHWISGAANTSGVFAVVIGLLSWLYLQSQLTILAAEINVVRREHLWPRSLTGRTLGESDLRALARYAAVEQRVEGQELVVDLGPPAVEGYVRTSARSDAPT